CRKLRDDVKTAGGLLLRDQTPTKPVYGRSGIRHERWPELAKEAVERNVGAHVGPATVGVTREVLLHNFFSAEKIVAARVHAILRACRSWRFRNRRQAH